MAVSSITCNFEPLNLTLKLEKQHYAKTFTKIKRNGHLSCDQCSLSAPYVLLSTREKVVCGVQKGGFTEATVICSELFPLVVWLASGGLTMLNPAITRQWLWEMPYLCTRIQDAAFFVRVTRRTGPRKVSPFCQKG